MCYESYKDKHNLDGGFQELGTQWGNGVSTNKQSEQGNDVESSMWAASGGSARAWGRGNTRTLTALTILSHVQQTSLVCLSAGD